MNKMVIATAAALTVAAGTPAPVAAQETVRVASADLRLDRARDVAQLDRRIGRAARAACGWTADWDLHGRTRRPAAAPRRRRAPPRSATGW